MIRTPFTTDGPAFGLLWSANLTASLAGWSLGLVVSVHVWTTTGSATTASTLLIATTAPAALLGGAAGRLADRYDRRRLLLLSSGVRVPLVSSLALVPLQGSGVPQPAAVVTLLVLVAADATARQMFVPAEQGLLVDVAGPDLPAAVSANSAGANAARLAAPAAGGALYAVGGFSCAVAVIAVLLTVVALLVFALPRSLGAAATAVGERGGSSLHLVWRDPHLRAVAVLQAVDGVKEGALSSLFVAFMVGTVGVGAGSIGATNGVFAVGALCAVPLVPVVVRRWGFRRAVGVGAFCSAVVLLPAFLVPGGWTAVGGFALAGFPFTVSWVAAGTLLLLQAPPARRSSVVGSTNAVWAGAMLSSAAIAGPLADRVGVVPVLVVATLVHAAAGLSFLVVCPADQRGGLRQRDVGRAGRAEQEMRWPGREPGR